MVGITELSIQDFRSIQQAKVRLAPVTVVYGPNSAGKSSILYSLLALRNIVLNPNQDANGFFNFGFANLGSFESVSFEHHLDSTIQFGLTKIASGIEVTYQIQIRRRDGGFRIYLNAGGNRVESIHLDVTFPYPGGQQSQEIISFGGEPYKVNWNGIVAQVQAHEEAATKNEAEQLATLLNSVAESIRQISIVPLKRGFTKPQYSTVPVSQMPTTEDEVATSLSNDKYLVSKVSHYLEQILGRDLRVNVNPGTAIFSLDATDRNTGVASELVNEGFGVNQLVYLLAKCLPRDTRLCCVEEPEVHLHPSAVRKLAESFVAMAHNENKQFLISTHSEALVIAFLALVAKGEIAPADLAFYHVTKPDRITIIEPQEVNEHGQLEGGLASFIAGEMEDIAAFLGVSE